MFYVNFVKLCNSIGKSPSAVAEEIGVKRSTVTRWKQGKSITDANLQKVADYFGLSVDDLTKEMQKEKPTLQMESELDPVTQEIFDMMKDMSKEELLLLKARAEKIKESR